MDRQRHQIERRCIKPRRLRTARRGRRGRFFPDPRVVGDDNATSIGCIDLTSTEDEHYVDLTANQSLNAIEPIEVEEAGGGVNDESVVVIGTPDDSPRRRGRDRQHQTTEPYELPPVRSSRIPFRLPPLGVDDDDLPPGPFEVTTIANTSQSNRPNSLLQSPEAIKITCPVCLEDDKSIKRMKRSLVSTICGHVFCDECIQSAVRSQQCCPVCRKKLSLRNVHKLHI